jgi:uncharacterized membrane protein
VHERGEEEFARVLTFSDGVFAIAMTLLVVGIGLPALADQADESELLGKLDDVWPEIFSFFLSFAVIGRYWLAHHQFCALLRSGRHPLHPHPPALPGAGRLPAVPHRSARQLL